MSGKKHSSPNSRPIAEWVVGILSAITVCALIAFLAYEALFGDAQPPKLTAMIDSVEQVEGGTLVVVAVANAGDQAAAEVVVAASAMDGPDAPGKQLRFDYVAAHAVRRGAFVVEGLPAETRNLRLHVLGYVEP